MVAPPQLMAARKQRETDKKGPEQDVTLRETPAIHFLKPGSWSKRMGKFLDPYVLPIWNHEEVENFKEELMPIFLTLI
jgi:hypothetical protein